MKLSFYNYELVPLATKKQAAVRKGALLKVEFIDGTTGFADCHPWPEHGDLPLQQQLEKLKNGATTPLIERSLYFAEMDAITRSFKKSAFENLQVPKSNWLITNLEETTREEIETAARNQFTCFKIKVGNCVDQELLCLHQISEWLIAFGTDFKFRLDFNLKLTQAEFLNFLSRSKSLYERIDYIEDPFPFNIKQWAAIQKQYGMRLACDFHSHLAINHPEAATVLVVKPAIQDEAIFLESLNADQYLVITSYLNHPLGQVAAAYAAALCYAKSPKQVGVCGLATQHLYEPNPFSELLTVTETRLNAPSGTGMGFDQLLEELAWENF